MNAQDSGDDGLGKIVEGWQIASLFRRHSA
jgi:hypothetical protein